MTKDKNAVELQETELDDANGGFRIEHDTNALKGPGHKKAEMSTPTDGVRISPN